MSGPIYAHISQYANKFSKQTKKMAISNHARLHVVRKATAKKLQHYGRIQKAKACRLGAWGMLSDTQSPRALNGHLLAHVCQEALADGSTRVATVLLAARTRNPRQDSDEETSA